MRGSKPIPPITRFWTKIDGTTADGCWVWIAGRDSHGYGVFSIDRRSVGAHRWAYEWFIGPIPAGLQVDHLCRNRACVNPRHLQAVSPRENTLRGTGITAMHARKTHCIHGHEYTPENTYVQPRRPNARFCRECKRVQARRR